MNTEIEALLYSQEKLLLEQRVRKSARQLNSILADNFIEIGSSGKTYNKEQLMEALRTESSAVVYEIEDFKIFPLTEDIMLATYKAFHISDLEQTINSMRSSIWQSIEGKWKIVFHQGTLIR